MTTKVQYIRYGISHSKRYAKSPVADFLIDKVGESDNDICICNDIKLLLREKNIHKQIGVDLLRDYVEQLQRSAPTSSEQVSFTDEELFQLIEPKDINNLTTSYLYARYLQDNDKKLKSRYDEFVERKKDYETFISKRDKIYESLKEK